MVNLNFSIHDFMDSLAAVINYNFADEEKDYCDMFPEDREGHVYEHLVTLQTALGALREFVK